MRAVQRRDAHAVGRPARLAPCLVRYGIMKDTQQQAPKSEQDQSCPTRRNLHGDDGAIGADVGLYEAQPVRDAMLHTVAFEVEIRADLALGGAVELREEVATTRIRHTGAERIAPTEAVTRAVAAKEVGAGSGASVIGRVHQRGVAEPAGVEGEVAVCGELVPPHERWLTLADAVLNGVAQHPEGGFEARAECSLRLAIDPVWNERGALRVDELPDGAVATRAREVVDEEGAVAVRAIATGEER